MKKKSFCGGLFDKLDKKKVFGIILMIVIIVLLVILGFVVLKDVLAPLMMSMAWALLLSTIKKVAKNLFFGD